MRNLFLKHLLLFSLISMTLDSAAFAANGGNNNSFGGFGGEPRAGYFFCHLYYTLPAGSFATTAGSRTVIVTTPAPHLYFSGNYVNTEFPVTGIPGIYPYEFVTPHVISVISPTKFAMQAVTPATQTGSFGELNYIERSCNG